MCQPVNDVRLDFYRPEYDEVLYRFHLPEEEARFTSLPSHLIQEAVRDKNQHPVVILQGKNPVGFFVLHSGDRVKAYTDNPRALLLASLSIDATSQGKGYGKSGMVLMRGFVRQHFPECNEVVLAVNHKNLPAQQLYKRAGFVDTGRRKIGTIGEQYILSCNI